MHGDPTIPSTPSWAWGGGFAFGDVWLKPKKDYIILWRVLRIPGNGSAVSVWEQARWRGRDETGMQDRMKSPAFRSRIVHITCLSIAPLMRSLSLAAKGVIAVAVTEKNGLQFNLQLSIADMGRRYPCRLVGLQGLEDTPAVASRFG